MPKPTLMRLLPVVPFALAGLVLWPTCSPQLTGEQCQPGGDGCPSGQTCVALGDGGAVCLAGASDGGDGGAPADAGPDGGPDAGADAGSDAGADAGADAGPDAGSGPQPTFAGTLVLNGGALPTQPAWVLGFDGGNPLQGDDAGAISGYTLITSVALDGGGFSIFDPVLDGGYRLYGIYAPGGNPAGPPSAVGTFSAFSPLVSAGTSAAQNIRLDVQTSTCFSLTIEIVVDAGGGPLAAGTTGATALFAAGAKLFDINNGQPFVTSGSLNATAVFDAGAAALPAGFNLPPSIALSAVTNVPLSGFSALDNSWIYFPPSYSPLSPTGAFSFFFSGVPDEFPNGTCEVGYAAPPAFPSRPVINSGTAITSGLWNSASAANVISWNDPSPAQLPGDALVLADLVNVMNTTNDTIFSTSLLPVPDGGTNQVVVNGSVDGGLSDCQLSIRGASACSVSVATVFAISRGRTVAYEGADNVAPFFSE